MAKVSIWFDIYELLLLLWQTFLQKIFANVKNGFTKSAIPKMLLQPTMTTMGNMTQIFVICVKSPKVTEASGSLDIYELLLLLWQTFLPQQKLF